MARQPRANAQDPARKRRLDEFDRRLTAMEGQVRTHEDRMENLEYRFELETAYRYLRIENSPGLDQMFKDLAAKTMENAEIRERTGQVLMREIREVFEREVEEGELSATSQANNPRRKWHTPAARKATLDAFNVASLVHPWWTSALALGIIGIICVCNKVSPLAWCSMQSKICSTGPYMYIHSIQREISTNSRFSQTADLRCVVERVMEKEKMGKSKMVKAKAPKARVKGKAKPEETRRARNPRNGSRIQAWFCENNCTFFLSMEMSHTEASLDLA